MPNTDGIVSTSVGFVCLFVFKHHQLESHETLALHSQGIYEAQHYKKIPLSRRFAGQPRQMIYLLAGLGGQLFS